MEGPLQSGKQVEQRILEHLVEGESLLDVGAGIRPCRLLSFPLHVCVEPHWEYVQVLMEMGFLVVAARAIEALSILGEFDCVYFLDVIEHMEEEEARKSIALAMRLARKQVVVFTPLGFVEQPAAELDAWGLHGGEWQEHKSGWLPEDFPGWTTFVDKDYHGNHGAFAAVYTK